MHTGIMTVPVSIVRGGTSKGIFIMENALPSDPALRDKVILAIFGSPDLRQIDGLGGADPLTSKLAIIRPTTRPDADIDYIFGQVSITEPYIDYKGNCGNISSAVGGYAIDKGLVAVTAPMTTVRIHMVNTGRILRAQIPVNEGRCCVDGDFSIDGVPGSGAKITIDWADCGGETTGKLLPTGNIIDTIEAGGKTYHLSVVDAGNVTVFITAQELNLSGTEYPADIESDSVLMALLEEIRGKAAQKIGLIDDWRTSAKISPYSPFISIISPPSAHQTFNGKFITQDHADVVSRLLLMQRVHKAHPVTGTVALGCAARIPGTVVNHSLSVRGISQETLNIAHPSGIIRINTQVTMENGQYHLAKSIITRTARIIMDGNVYVRNSQLASGSTNN